MADEPFDPNVFDSGTFDTEEAIPERVFSVVVSAEAARSVEVS